MLKNKQPLRPRDIYLLHQAKAQNDLPVERDAGPSISPANALSKITPEAVRTALSSRHLLHQLPQLFDISRPLSRLSRPLSRLSMRSLRPDPAKARFVGAVTGLFAVRV